MGACICTPPIHTLSVYHTQTHTQYDLPGRAWRVARSAVSIAQHTLPSFPLSGDSPILMITLLRREGDVRLGTVYPWLWARMGASVFREEYDGWAMTFRFFWFLGDTVLSFFLFVLVVISFLRSAPERLILFLRRLSALQLDLSPPVPALFLPLSALGSVLGWQRYRTAEIYIHGSYLF